MQAPGGPEEDPTGGFALGGWMFGYADESMDNARHDGQWGAPDIAVALRHGQPSLHGRKPEVRGVRDMNAKEREELLRALKARFEKNMDRHEGLEWAPVQARLEAQPEKLVPLYEMERTGGEPDVVGHDAETGEYVFFDCSAESPKGRRSYCYDREALEARKKHKPRNSAVDAAAAMGIELLTEEEYRELQTLGQFDMKTSSWVKTPSDVRKLGGALFCDRRFGRVFVYHNGADSYYAARGFRGSRRI